MITVIVISILLMCSYYYNSLDAKLSKDDLNITGVLSVNDTGKLTYRKYIMDIQVQKGEGKITLLPYTLDNDIFTYSNEDESEGFYIPGSIGSGYWVNTVAKKELINKNIISENSDVSLLGVGLPNEAGMYKVRLYIGDSESAKEIKIVKMIAVYNEKIIGKDLSWAKVLELKNYE